VAKEGTVADTVAVAVDVAANSAGLLRPKANIANSKIIDFFIFSPPRITFRKLAVLFYYTIPFLSTNFPLKKAGLTL
jgi:hypothetical protein